MNSLARGSQEAALDSVSLDRATVAANDALEKAGGKVELSGYIMDRADIDALLEIAKRFAVD